MRRALSKGARCGGADSRKPAFASRRDSLLDCRKFPRHKDHWRYRFPRVIERPANVLGFSCGSRNHFGERGEAKPAWCSGPESGRPAWSATLSFRSRSPTSRAARAQHRDAPAGHRARRLNEYGLFRSKEETRDRSCSCRASMRNRFMANSGWTPSSRCGRTAASSGRRTTAVAAADQPDRSARKPCTALELERRAKHP